MNNSNLREHLKAIYEERGRLTPEDVVDEARDPEHPLHNRFEWDDTTAAEAWRRTQAHELIRSCRVVYRTDPTGRDHTVRAFHAIRVTPADDEVDVPRGGYRYELAETVARDEFTARLLMQDMEREWKALRRRYDEFEEFWRMVRGEAEERAA